MTLGNHTSPHIATPKGVDTYFWIVPDGFSGPADATRFQDTDDAWKSILVDPEVFGARDKRESPAVCGMEFVEGAPEKSLEFVFRSHAMVLDVDVWGEVAPFSIEEIRMRLEGFRFIAWNSFSSTAEKPRWRVVIPLAMPMPPTKYKALWDIINGVLGNTMKATGNPDRIGFVGTIASEKGLDDYRWYIQPGERLDWTLFDLDDRELSVFKKALTPKDLSRSVDWSSDIEALESCKRYYRKVGRDVEEGSRHECLLRASCRLWWDWAASDDGFVRTILEMINANFPQPKSEQAVEDEVQAGYNRVLGERRVEQASAYGCEREPIMRASLIRFGEHARALKKRNNDQSRFVGHALAEIAQGHAFAEPQEARSLAFLCADEVAKLFPREKPERLVELLRPAIQAQQARSKIHPVPTDEEMVSKIKWTQRSRMKAYEEREQINKDLQRRQILSATGGTRDTAYTPRELKEWEAKGFSQNQWILQHDRAFYFFVGGEYRGPYSKEAANNFASTWLSPASEWVRTQYVDTKGITKSRGVDELVQEYGSFVEDVHRSMIVTETEYRSDNRKLTVATTPVRDLEPAFSSDVDKWLKVIAKDKYEILNDWMAALTLLDRPCAALFLCMAPGLGKTLFAHGLTRLWTTAGPTYLENDFQSSDLEKCPLVSCNEELPAKWQKSFASKLRAFLDESSRQAKKLYVDRYILVGYPRVILTGNNSRMVAGVTEAIRGIDVAALKERMLMIENEDGSLKQWLKEVIPRHRDFVEQDVLAKHVLWVRENRKIDSKNRFFVSDLGSEFESAFTVGQVSRSLVLEWIHEFLASNQPSAAVAAKDGVLLANSSLMFGAWEMFSQKKVGSREVMTSLSSIAPTRKSVIFDGKDGEATYRVVDMEKFFYWVNQNDGDENQIREAIATLEKKRPVKRIYAK